MRSKANRQAMKVAVIYVIIAGLWISLSDELVEIFVRDTSQHLYFSIAKGWCFVLLMGLILFQSLRILLARWEREALQRKAAEEVLKRTERALKTISDCNKELVRATDEYALLQAICRVIVEKGGYRMAWVGFAMADEKKSIRVASHAGFNDGYLEKSDITWAEGERGNGPTGLALRTGQVAICQDFQNDPRVAPWRAEALKRGFGSAIVLPLQHQQLLGVLTIYAAAANAFNPTEIELLKDLADDLAYGIQTLRARFEQELGKEALRASESRLQFLLTSTPAIIYSFLPGADRPTTFVSRNVQAVLGHEPAAFLNDPQFWQRNIHPDDFQKSFSPAAALPASGTIRREYRFRHQDGSYRWMHDELQAVCDQSGHVVEYVGYWFDITLRKQMDLELQESEARFRALVEGTEIAVFLSVNLTFTYLNPSALKLFGATHADQLVGQPVLSRIHPDYHAAIKARAGKIYQGQKGVAPAQPEIHLRLDGSSVLVEVTASPITFQGQPGAVVFVQDITARKAAEETLARLATAVDQAAETIVITDLDGVIVYANPAFERSTGYTCAEALGQTSNMLKSGRQNADFYRRMWSVLAQGEIWTGHFVNRRKDGELYEEEATISPVRNAQGNIVNYVAVKRDVTREVQLENQFRQAQKMEAIGTLAGGIAHDFNNMLAAMFGYCFLLQEDTAGNDSAQENIQEILQAATRAKDLVTQILMFSRQREQKRAIIRLDTVIKEALKFLRASLPTNIKIESSYAPETPSVLADPTQIYQVAINLATNALHAMENHNGVLTVTVDTFQPDAEFILTHPNFRDLKYARIVIADTGHGMDATTLERIFEPFFTTKPVGKGTGLGLAVVHGIIQSHEGAIIVTSRPGQGTTFCLYFPEQTDPATLSKPPSNSIHNGTGQRILLVDDEPALTKIFERLLRRLNYQVTICNSASEAIQVFQLDQRQFDLAITDLTMPEMSGLELAQELRRRRADFPVILASGYTATFNHEQLREAGICELLEKPVTLMALAETVERALARSDSAPVTA